MTSRETTNRTGSDHDPFVGSETSAIGGCGFLDWMSAVPYTRHHEQISEGRLEGTGEWILRKEEYCEWRSSTGSTLLLLRGSPATGKTYTASRVIDSLLSNPKSGNVAYFYCNRDENSRRDPESILRTLVKQLSRPLSKEILGSIVDGHGGWVMTGGYARVDIPGIQQQLAQLTDILPETTICIDALDEVEAGNRMELLKALWRIMDASKNPVKIFATVQMDTDVSAQFLMSPRIELPPDNVGDINRFVETSVQKAIRDRRLLRGDVVSELKTEICNVLCERAQGAFQLAPIQINLLCDSATQEDLRRSLHAVPDTVEDAYGEVFKRIIAQKDSAARMALNAFRWIQCAYEPLRSATLLDAVTVDLGGTGRFSHSYKADANDVLKGCRGLVILDEGQDVFRFAHHAMDEYLETQLPAVESHAEIAMTCLSLLCASRSWCDYDTSLRTSEKDGGARHLLLYSTVFWPWHFAHCDEGNDCQILAALWSTFISENCYQLWMAYHRQRVKTNTYSDDRFWQRTSALQHGSDDVLSCVCLFGLGRKFPAVFNSVTVENARIDQLIAFRLRRKFPTVFKPQPEEKARIDRLLLQACKFGDLDIVRLLAGVGADVTADDNLQQTPLHMASQEGHEAVARLLLDRGADASAAGLNGQMPLHLAANGGHEDVVRLLITRADVLARDKGGLTPLHLASTGGHEMAVRLLVDWGADVSAIDFSGKNPLHLALRRGYETVVRLLVERGADVAAVDRRQRTPLHLASATGNETAARLLVAHGADVQAADATGRTPLHLAEERGHEEVARFLRNCCAHGGLLTAAPASPPSLQLLSEYVSAAPRNFHS